MGSSGGSASQTMEFKPPAYAAPYWEQLVKQGGELTSQAPTQYMGQRIADLAPETYQAMDMTSQWAKNSTPDVLAGRENIANTAAGGYLGANPYSNNPWTDNVIANNTENMAGGFAAGTAAQNAALANMQGAFGGSGYTQKQSMDAANLAKMIGQQADQTRMNQTNLASQNWEAERARQMQASGMAPALQNMDAQASQALAGVGDVSRAYQQQLLDSLYSNWQQGQMAPFQSLDTMRNLLSAASGGVAGGSSQQGSTGGGGFSPLAGLLGGGLAAYGLYNGMK